MGSDQSWIKNFVGRCESVGWRVEFTKSCHHKVYDRDGKFLFVFGGTPGDKRALLNTLAQAKRHGIEQLETGLKLLNERTRLERIERDRALNGHREVPTAVFVPQPLTAVAAATTPPERARTRTEKVNRVDTSADLGSVDGVVIVAVGPAKTQTPVMTKPAPLADAEELLLADERVIYRCAKPAATPQRPDLPGLCHRTFDTVNSLRAHIIYHSRAVLPTTPQQRAQAARSQEDTTVTATQTRVKTDTGAETSLAVDSPPDQVSELRRELQALTGQLDKLTGDLDEVVSGLRGVYRRVTELPVTDPEAVAKAAKFDAVQASMKNLFG